jgi:hypothetical protein
MYVGGGWRSENAAGERGRRPMMRCVRPMMRCVRPMMRGVCDKRCAVCATNDAVCAVCAAETKRRKLRVSHVHHARRSATLQRSRLGIAAPRPRGEQRHSERRELSLSHSHSLSSSRSYSDHSLHPNTLPHHHCGNALRASTRSQQMLSCHLV